MKIAIFASGHLDQIGGIQRSYQSLCGALIKNRYSTTLIGYGRSLTDPVDPASLMYPLHQSVTVRIIEQKFHRTNFKAVVELLSDLKPDVVLVVNSGQAGLFYCLAAKSLGLRVIYSMRGGPEYCLRYLWPSKYTLDLIAELSDSLHLLMPSYSEFFYEGIRDKIKVIPSPISKANLLSDVAKGNSDGKFTILYSGRLSFEKRIHLLLYAFSKIASRFYNWNLMIAGDGPLEGDLRDLADQLKIAERIIWVSASNTDEMYRLYPECHVKVLPSEDEGCPMALREAMAHGIPVVGFDECSGTNDIIVNKKNGYLLRSDKPVDRLAEALSALCNDPELRVELGRAAYLSSLNYDPEKINASWLELIEKTIKGSSGYGSSLPLFCGLKPKDLFDDLIKKEIFYGIRMYDRPKDLLIKYLHQYSLIFGRKLFDTKYYLETNIDVKRSGMDPLLHYVSCGFLENRNPSPLFSVKEYRRLYIGEDNSVDPLVHFYEKGFKSGCWPIPADPYYYSSKAGSGFADFYSISDDF